MTKNAILIQPLFYVYEILAYLRVAYKHVGMSKAEEASLQRWKFTLAIQQ